MFTTNEELMGVVAALGYVTVEDLRGPSRKSEVVAPRHEAMWLLHRRGLSLASIGALFGERDHKTVRHACQKVERLKREADAGVQAPTTHNPFPATYPLLCPKRCWTVCRICVPALGCRCRQFLPKRPNAMLKP